MRFIKSFCKWLVTLSSLLLLGACIANKYPPERKIKDLVTPNQLPWSPPEFQLDLDSIKVPLEQNSVKGYIYMSEWLEKSRTYFFAILHGNNLVWRYQAPKYHEKSLIECFSLTKFIIATLVGIAINENYLEIDTPVTTYLPQLLDSKSKMNWNSVSTRHLLTHTSGVEPGGAWPHLTFWMAPNVEKKIHKVKLKNPSGTQHIYSPANYQILVEVLEAATGKSVEDYFIEKLGRPLNWGPAKWRCDPHYQAFGFAGFIAHPLDIAKFTRLLLQDGNWNGKQILSTEWVSEAIRGGKQKPGRPDITIGHLYIDPSTSGNFSTVGYTGHILYASPKDDLLVVRFSDSNVKDENTLRDQIRYVLEQVSAIL